jgi:hypothetical protein
MGKYPLSLFFEKQCFIKIIHYLTKVINNEGLYFLKKSILKGILLFNLFNVFIVAAILRLQNIIRAFSNFIQQNTMLLITYYFLNNKLH